MTEVRTTAGVLRGVREAGCAVFRGIPYAEPPVGELRFAEPHPVRPWEGARPATAFGPPPPQSGLLGASTNEAGNNWLTLNVWTPEASGPPGMGGTRQEVGSPVTVGMLAEDGPSIAVGKPEATGVPVMVWIPGGGYMAGDASLPEFDGARLAASGVVVVTVNYRLGVEGFAQIDGVPANRGLLDQVAALGWVRENIGAFGGDPERVTIFGQSAGGGSVAALLAMPRAVGLFRRAIVQSMPGTFFAPELAGEITAACAAELGVRPQDLRTIEPALLALAGDAVSDRMADWRDRWGAITHRPIPFAPVVDGNILPTTPWQALANGAASGIDLLVGHTRDEHRLFSLIDGVLGEVTPEQTATALQMLAPGPDYNYRAKFPHATDEELYEIVNGDWLFRMPSLHLAEAQITGGGRAHLYELTWAGPLGACHGLDLPLVFGNLTSGQPATLLGDPHEAEALSTQMRTAWVDFATHGTPGWPPYDAQRLTRIFNFPSAVDVYPEEASRLLWQDHAFDALQFR